MSGATSMVMAAAAVAGAAVSYNAAQDQKKANAAAQANALKQEKAASEATNRANQKRPDTASILSAAQQSGMAGASGTMLTGPSGIDPEKLKLGRSTLLGG